MLTKTKEAAIASTAAALKLQKSSSEFAAEYEKYVGARDAAAAEFENLQAGEAEAKRAGVDVLRQHRRKMEDAELRRDVMAQLAEDCARERDAAIEREREQERVSAYEANEKEGSAWQKEVRSAYEELVRKTQALLARGKDIQQRRDLLNRDLPMGREALAHVESFRHLPPVPDREEEYEADEMIVRDGMVIGIGYERPKTHKVTRVRVIKGSPPVRPAPLWECFQAAGLKPGDLPFIVSNVVVRPLR
jgi:hypothetical protein